jgi:hypothetical protein
MHEPDKKSQDDADKNWLYVFACAGIAFVAGFIHEKVRICMRNCRRIVGPPCYCRGNCFVFHKKMGLAVCFSLVDLLGRRIICILRHAVNGFFGLSPANLAEPDGKST